MNNSDLINMLTFLGTKIYIKDENYNDLFKNFIVDEFIIKNKSEEIQRDKLLKLYDIIFIEPKFDKIKYLKYMYLLQYQKTIYNTIKTSDLDPLIEGFDNFHKSLVGKLYPKFSEYILDIKYKLSNILKIIIQVYSDYNSKIVENSNLFEKPSMSFIKLYILLIYGKISLTIFLENIMIIEQQEQIIFEIMYQLDKVPLLLDISSPLNRNLTTYVSQIEKNVDYYKYFTDILKFIKFQDHIFEKYIFEDKKNISNNIKSNSENDSVSFIDTIDI
jgi:hypothetical protein